MRSLRIVGGVAAGYGVAAELATVMRPSEAIPAFVPTAGISIAALVLLDRRRWPVTLLAIAAAGIAVDLGRGLTLTDSLVLALATTCQAGVAAGLLRRLAPEVTVARSRDVAAFVAAAMVAGPLVGAAIASSVYSPLPGMTQQEAFLNWWVGNAVGALIVGATIIAWQRSPATVPRRSWWEWTAVLGGMALVTSLHALTDTVPLAFQLAFLPVPLLLWAALRLGERGVLNAGSILAVVACLPASWGYGLWASNGDEASFGPSLRVFLVITVLGTWLIAIEVGGRERAERSHDTQYEIATRLQRALLPGALPTVPGVSAVARYRPGDDLLSVGGDWYDLVARPDGRLVAVVGDVVGHDLTAAAAMGRLRSALAAIAVDATDPADAFARLERFAETQSPVAFTTASYLELDPGSGRLRYACAGHPPPLVLPPVGEPTFLTGGRSLPLFTTAAGHRPVGETDLAPGAVLVGYTDGLVERRESSFVVGLGRLRQTAESARDEPLEAFADTLVGGLTAGQHMHDDIALLCLRVTPDRALPADGVAVPAAAVPARSVAGGSRRLPVDSSTPGTALPPRQAGPH